MQVLLSAVCLALTSAVVGNAYYQKRQFYPAVVHITKSNASMAVIYVQFFVIVFMFGKLLRKIFLGTLRAAEFEHLLERFWYALTEMCLAFTVFRDDFNPRFVALFTVLLFLKSFHWLAEERVDFMERSPVLGWLFHLRVASLLLLLGILDHVFLQHAYEITIVRGPSVQLVFGFEYAILLTMVTSIIIKYVLHAAEMRTDTPWENKAVFLLYTELVIGFIKVVLYVFFVFIMAKIYALPMFVFRPMFFTIRNFKKALSDVIMSRRAIRNMNTLYPDATPEELQLSDNICIICREDMVNHSKKLPCGHIFHTTCLRSWFQRQQTCPTCRLNILRTPTNSTAIPRQQPEANAAAAAPQPAPPGPAAASTVLPNATQNATSNSINNELNNRDTIVNENGNNTSNAANVAQFPAGTSFQTMPMVPPPFMIPPPFSFLTPYTVSPPPMPPDLETLTEEELRALEGNERKNIEERIKLLRNIQVMLDAATVLMHNYQIAYESTMPSSSHNCNENATSDEQASTSKSAAAAAASETNIAHVSDATNDVTTNSIPTTDSLIENQNSTAALNKVTIEDIGGEDTDFNVTTDDVATTSNAITESVIDNFKNERSNSITTTEQTENNELNELRKRRLKFLEEQVQPTSIE